MAKMMNTKMASPRMPLSCFIDLSKVPIRSFILGILCNDLSGRKSLNVLNPDTFFIDGS